MTLSKEEKQKGRVLLPSHVVPERYDLHLTPDLEAFTFSGTCDITLKVDAAKLDDTNRNTITLHSKELCFATAQYTVVDGNTTAVPADEIAVNVKATTVTFAFGTALSGDRIKLSIHYTGFLNNQMAGFYRSQYTDISGNTKVMASTQFESLDARRCFPCVDEPAAKAVFGVSVTVPAHLQVLSNMPASKQESLALSSNKQRNNKISFLDTPIMSTYLLALCVGEFDCLSQMTEHGVMVSVYTPPGKSASGQFALQVAARSLDAYDDFFQIHFPLPKLDMIAIPEFAMGAMENWGLVTYREVDLLIDPVTASSSQKQRVATVVAHELAHQWFGNLVTMRWWDDLWLNEGFASWAENWATDLLFPEYHMWDQFTTGHLTTAMRLDALRSSHPIQVAIQHAEEVEQVFDAISYCKGGSVVRMIKAILGMKHFQTGLSNYMHKYAYANTETIDLWTAWEEVSKMPVNEMMASWTEQMGFPLVRVVEEDWQDDKVTLKLEQMWFLSDGSELDAEGAAKKWTIPIMTCTIAGTQADMTLMREKSASITIPVNAAGGWVKLNAGQEVPMRVLNSAKMLQHIAPAIQSKQLNAIDRAALVNDAYALVKAGHQSPASVIELLGHYKDEDEYVVWEGLADCLGGLNAVLSENDDMSTMFRGFAKTMVVSLMNKVGWEPQETDAHLTTLLRGIMVGLVSSFAYDDEAVASEAKRRFAAFQADPNDMQSLPSDMRTSVFKIVLQNGGAKEYDAVKSYFYKADTGAEKKNVLNSLGATPDNALKLATMEWSTSGEIKLQDFFYLMGSVGRSKKAGREIAWQYYKDNFETIKAMVGNASASLMDACIMMCGGGFCTDGKAGEIEAFFAANPLPKNTRKIEQLIEGMRANAKFLDILLASELSKKDFWDGL